MPERRSINYAAQYDDWVRRYGPANREIQDTPRARKARPPVSESFLRCLWYDQLFIPKLLATEHGDPIVVEFPGFWNVGPGPDFTGARLRIGGRDATGDVELHLRAGDWKTHGHSADKVYSGVVLHAALWKGTEAQSPRNASNREIPQAILEECLVRPLEELVGEIDPEHYPARSPSVLGLCHPHVAAGERARERMLQWIGTAADARFESKMRRAERWIDETASMPDAFACSWVENWGFGGFREAYLHAGLACRSAGLRALLEGGSRIAEDRVETLLINSIQTGLAASARRSSRPSLSHPRRVSFITHTILGLFVEQGWLVLEQMIRALNPKDEPRVSLRTLREGLDVLLARPTRCALLEKGGKSLSPALRPGSETRDILLLNFLIPLAAAWARHEGAEDRARHLHAVFSTMPRLPENRVERAAVRRIFGGNPAKRRGKGEGFLKTARFQQGLHRLYEDFCSKGLDGCERCPLPSSLREVTRE